MSCRVHRENRARNTVGLVPIFRDSCKRELVFVWRQKTHRGVGFVDDPEIVTVSKSVDGEGLEKNVEKTQQELEDEYEEDWTVVDLTTIPDDTLVQKLWWFYTWPINVLYFLTVPDSRLEKRRKLYPLTFIMAIVWIGISSYITSWMITEIGDTFGIPSSVMGLVFIAAGGDIPESVSSTLMVLKEVIAIPSGEVWVTSAQGKASIVPSNPWTLALLASLPIRN
uniref:Sodium/calcium exchanger membrane region domain-containing protein n=1 Tax=Timema bartmani TaxID=61472 RepID=A0A7R9FBG9_9NEOP|nr:unnamed protein product [Timema bartmani]